MKKSILIIALVGLCAATFSQIKQPKKVRTQKDAKPYLDSLIKLDKQGKALDSVFSKPKAKAQYVVDPNRLYEIPLKLTATQVSLLISSPEEWKAIKSSEQLKGSEITGLENAAEDLRKSIRSYVAGVQQNDYLKWLAKQDSTAKPKLPVKTKK